MAISCFQRALGLASDDLQADIWYNIGHVALVRVLAWNSWCLLSVQEMGSMYILYNAGPFRQSLSEFSPRKDNRIIIVLISRSFSFFYNQLVSMN